MNPNVLICQSESELESLFSTDFIIHIDSKKSLTLRQFYEVIADQLEIPDFGFTLDELSDSLSDLHWLDEDKVVLYITATNDFLTRERDTIKIVNVLSMLDAVAEDWKWVEDETDDEKEIIIVFEDSDRIRKLLTQGEIHYAKISSLSQRKQ